MPAMMSRGRGRRTISEINMVPFIDVMLVLLIIFMVTAPLIAPSMIDLPSVGKAAKQPDAVIQIVIQKDDSLEIKSGKAQENVAQAAISTRSKSGEKTASWQRQYRRGHQRRQSREVRNRGGRDGQAATRRHCPRRPVGAVGQVALTSATPIHGLHRFSHHLP